MGTRFIVGICVLLMVASCARFEGGALEDAATSLPPITPATPETTAPSTTQPPTTRPVSTTSTSVDKAPEISTELSDEATADATDLMVAFLDALAVGDPAAIDFWSGYPVIDKDREFARFISEFDWMRNTDTLSLVITPSAGWGSPAPVVTVDNSDGKAASFVLSPRFDDTPPQIQRLPSFVDDDRFTPEPGLMVKPGDVITYKGIPVEGHARAFVNGVEIQDVTVDHLLVTTSFVIPRFVGELATVTFSLSSPELTSAATVVYRAAN